MIGLNGSISNELRALTAREISAVSGGVDVDPIDQEIIVIGTKIDTLSDYDLWQLSLAADLQSHALYGNGGYNGGEGITPSDVILWWMPDGDLEDFREWIVENTDINLETSMIDTFKVGDSKYAIVWDGTGKGQIYKITDHTFKDDTYTYFGNAKVSIGSNSGASAGFGNTGGTVTTSSGTTLNIELTGYTPAG